MKTTTEYLDLIQQRYGEETKSDNRLAIKLGITRQAISQYRRGQQMSVTVALRVAAVLDLHPAEPVFASLYHQASSAEEKTFWMQMYEILSRIRD